MDRLSRSISMMEFKNRSVTNKVLSYPFRKVSGVSFSVKLLGWNTVSVWAGT